MEEGYLILSNLSYMQILYTEVYFREGLKVKNCSSMPRKDKFQQLPVHGTGGNLCTLHFKKFF